MILNIQEIHDLVFGGCWGCWVFSWLWANTDLYRPGSWTRKRRRQRRAESFPLWSCFRSNSPFLHGPFWTLVWKIPCFNSLPPPSLSSDSDCKPEGIPCFLLRIKLFGNMAFIHSLIHSFTHSLTHQLQLNARNSKMSKVRSLPLELLAGALRISEWPVHLLFEVSEERKALISLPIIF